MLAVNAIWLMNHLQYSFPLSNAFVIEEKHIIWALLAGFMHFKATMGAVIHAWTNLWMFSVANIILSLWLFDKLRIVLSLVSKGLNKLIATFCVQWLKVFVLFNQVRIEPEIIQILDNIKLFLTEPTWRHNTSLAVAVILLFSFLLRRVNRHHH